MKKIFLMVVACMFFHHQTSAQNIVNPSFDSLYIGALDRVLNWVTSDGFIFSSGLNGDTVIPLTPHTFYDANGNPFSEVYNGLSIVSTPHSTTAIRLNTVPQVLKENGTTFESFLVNGNHFVTDKDGFVDFSKCGTAFPYRPAIFKGRYRFSDSLSVIDNYGKCVLLLKKYNTSLNKIDTIAYEERTMEFRPTTGWESFEFPIQYRSNETPDSIVVAFFANAFPGSTTTFSVDELSFEYPLTSIHESENEAGITTVFPNPNSGTVHINVSEQQFTQFRLLDVEGKLLKQGAFFNDLSVAEYPNELLILQLITTAGKTESFKLIKKD